MDLNTYAAKYFNEKDDIVDNPIKYLTLGELDCTTRGELFDRGHPFIPWLLTTGGYGAPVLAPCEMTGLTQRAQLSTQMLTSVLISSELQK